MLRICAIIIIITIIILVIFHTDISPDTSTVNLL